MGSFKVGKKEFSKIYYDYAQAIYRYCLYRVYSKDVAEDLMQEVFIKTWKYLKAGKKIENIRPFLYRVAKNLIVDFYRGAGKTEKKKKSLDEMVDNNRLPLGLYYNQKQKIESKLFLDEVFKVISRLPKPYQDVLVMRYVEDLTPKEIAEIFNTTIKNISARKKRAIRKLDSILREND